MNSKSNSIQIHTLEISRIELQTIPMPKMLKHNEKYEEKFAELSFADLTKHKCVDGSKTY